MWQILARNAGTHDVSGGGCTCPVIRELNIHAPLHMTSQTDVLVEALWVLCATVDIFLVFQMDRSDALRALVVHRAEAYGSRS